MPICFVLEHLFRLAIKMETQPLDHSVTLPGDIQVRVPLLSNLVRMNSTLLDLVSWAQVMVLLTYPIAGTSALVTQCADPDPHDMDIVPREQRNLAQK
ncbi:hypothetical protein KEM48_002243 [Puccinia striiformis f. sp. tritici PST-130]|nr:hypothetical protein KEM48_002243 [Puccinia striiformis f. sp. tritici PST-130]